MSAEIKLPRASSSRFHSLRTKEEKDKFIQQYKAWKNNPFTKEFISFLEAELESEIESEEKKDSFLSRFQFNFSVAVSKGKRSVLRKLINAI